LTNRVLVVAGAALLVALLGAYALRPATGLPADAPTLDEMADAIGAPIMGNLRRGHVPGRSGELMTVPKPHRYFIGEWDLTTLGSDTPVPTSSHPNPWAYLARVPIVLYGPGRVPRGVQVRDAVDVAALAPTYAALLGMPDPGVDGKVLPEIVRAAPRSAPAVIVTFVLDGGGWNALQEHPEQWPTIARLMRAGTLYTNATIGSAPSITGAIHATIGTGDYPVSHGIPGNQLRDPNGANVDSYLENANPKFLRSPAISELWDEANRNAPWVGTVSYEGWHLGMIGHGAQRAGGDRDVAVLWDVESGEWWINEEFYELPRYLRETDLDRLMTYERRLDQRDGVKDGLWFGHELSELQQDTVRPGTPAFARFTGDAIMQVLRREPVGRDALTDLFWIEMKMPDYAGHAWNMLGPEEGDVIFETDRQLARVKAFLDDSIGRGGYIIAVTADHGQQPLADLFGGWRVNNHELERDVEERFGAPIVEKVTPVDFYMDMDEVASAEISLSDVARYLGTYTIGDNIRDGQPGVEFVPEARLEEKLFAGAFPTDYLQALTPDKIASFGASDYSEGDLGLPGPRQDQG
jgi:hypothetical protein